MLFQSPVLGVHCRFPFACFTFDKLLAAVDFVETFPKPLITSEGCLKTVSITTCGISWVPSLGLSCVNVVRVT